MADDTLIIELDRRIEAIRENIRQLVEQAAAYSGAADEDRTADRIAQQDERLTGLLKEREELVKASGGEHHGA